MLKVGSRKTVEKITLFFRDGATWSRRTVSWIGVILEETDILLISTILILPSIISSNILFFLIPHKSPHRIQTRKTLVALGGKLHRWGVHCFVTLFEGGLVQQIITIGWLWILICLGTHLLVLESIWIGVTTLVCFVLVVVGASHLIWIITHLKFM